MLSMDASVKLSCSIFWARLIGADLRLDQRVSTCINVHDVTMSRHDVTTSRRHDVHISAGARIRFLGERTVYLVQPSPTSNVFLKTQTVQPSAGYIERNVHRATQGTFAGSCSRPWWSLTDNRMRPWSSRSMRYCA